MRWLFILLAKALIPPPPPCPSGVGARPKTTPEAMYTDYTSRTGAEGWMGGWKSAVPTEE